VPLGRAPTFNDGAWHVLVIAADRRTRRCVNVTAMSGFTVE